MSGWVCDNCKQWTATEDEPCKCDAESLGWSVPPDSASTVRCENCGKPGTSMCQGCRDSCVCSGCATRRVDECKQLRAELAKHAAIVEAAKMWFAAPSDDDERELMLLAAILTVSK